MIERFHQVDDQRCWQSQTFGDRAYLAAERPHGEAFHHPQHRDATVGQRPSQDVHSAHRRRRLPSRFTPHRQHLPWRGGRVSFMRLADTRGQVRLFSQSFLVDAALVHEYVTGAIAPRLNQLAFVHRGHRITR